MSALAAMTIAICPPTADQVWFTDDALLCADYHKGIVDITTWEGDAIIKFDASDSKIVRVSRLGTQLVLTSNFGTFVRGVVYRSRSIEAVSIVTKDVHSNVIVVGLDERNHLVAPVPGSDQFPEMQVGWSPDVNRMYVSDGTGLAWWKKSATEHQVSVWTGVDERKILKFVVPGLPSGVAWDGQSFIAAYAADSETHIHNARWSSSPRIDIPEPEFVFLAELGPRVLVAAKKKSPDDDGHGLVVAAVTESGESSRLLEVDGPVTMGEFRRRGDQLCLAYTLGWPDARVHESRMTCFE